MSTNTHINQGHAAMTAKQIQGEGKPKVGKKNMETEKSGKEMRKAESGEDSRAKGTSQIDTEKLMRNCKEGCV